MSPINNNGLALNPDRKWPQSRFVVDKWSKNGPNFCQFVTTSQINNNGSALNPVRKWPQSRFVADKWSKNGPNFC